jgi:RNA polymerase sigma factor (sigma-70 family)
MFVRLQQIGVVRRDIHVKINVDEATSGPTGGPPIMSSGPHTDDVDRWGATDETYRLHYRTMLRVAYSITGSHAAAEDAVHDAFCSVGPKIGTLDDPVPYLRVAVVNRCRSVHRREAKAPPPPPPDNAESDVGLLHFGDALDSLTFAQRTSIVLRYLCDLSDEQIAAILHCRRATVRSHVRRGLHLLKQELS